MHLCNATLRVVIGVQEINILVGPNLQPVIDLQILEVVGQGQGVVKGLLCLKVIVVAAGPTLGQHKGFVGLLIVRVVAVEFGHAAIGSPSTFKVECLS